MCQNWLDAYDYTTDLGTWLDWVAVDHWNTDNPHTPVHADAEKTLRVLGERGDIIRTMQRAMSGQPRELANYPAGAVVEVCGSAEVRAADKNITALTSDCLYRADHHLAIEQGRAKAGRDPQEIVAAHVRRLEALRRAGIVERVAEGLWKVPDDLAERGRQYDAQRLGGVAVELKSHLPIGRPA